MLSKSNSFVLVYAIVAAAIMVCFLLIHQGELGTQLAKAGVSLSSDSLDSLNRLSGWADVIALLALVVTGVVTDSSGGSRQGVMSVGTIASFIVLTAHQDLVMIRYMSLAGVLFAIGVYGMVVSRNAIRMLISIELMINAANINFVTFARNIDPSDVRGQIFAIFVLAVAAAEAAVGLAIVLSIYRNMTTVDMEKFNLLKW